jgi:hypothetical protein
MTRRATSGVTGCHLTQEMRVQKPWDDVEGNIWQALTDTARHVTGCHLTQETRARMPLDDVAGNICQAPCSPCHGMPFDSRDEGSQAIV